MPDLSDDDEAMALYKSEKAQHDADLEVWKEEVKLVARRRMEEKPTSSPLSIWRQCTSVMRKLLRSPDVFLAIDENNDVVALLNFIRASTVVDQRSQHTALSALQAVNKFISFRQMNLQNEIIVEGVHDQVHIYEEVTGEMLGCDVKRVEEKYGGSIANVDLNNPNLIAAKKNVETSFWRSRSLNAPTKAVFLSADQSIQRLSEKKGR
jgi:hypothetical protein